MIPGRPLQTYPGSGDLVAQLCFMDDDQQLLDTIASNATEEGLELRTVSTWRRA